MSCRMPIDCVLAVTYRCNSRCLMCDIWKTQNFPELAPTEFLKLPRSLRDVNLSGGEPFLRADLPEIVRQVARACPRSRIVISSNGFATDLIVEKMRAILKIKPDIGVAISIDGIGPLHDELRGVPGGFERALATVRALQGLGMTNLRLAFTLMDKNVAHFGRVYDLARELGVQFTHSFAQSSDFYFGGKQNVNELRREAIAPQYAHVIAGELRGWNVKRWLRAYYTRGAFDFITARRPPLSSAPGRDFFFMDPAGRIYPSVVHNVVMIEDFASPGFDFARRWCAPDAAAKRRQIDAHPMPLWMMCVARTAMRRHPVRVMWWVIKNKIAFNPNF